MYREYVFKTAMNKNITGVIKRQIHDYDIYDYL